MPIRRFEKYPGGLEDLTVLIVTIFQGALWGVIAGWCGTFWIISGAQVLISQGKLKYDTLPLSIEGCHHLNITKTLQIL